MKKDIKEVKKADKTCRQINKINPYSIDNLKKVHGILSFLIEKDAEKFKNHVEDVYDWDVCIFTCLLHKLVPILMDNLFA